MDKILFDGILEKASKLLGFKKENYLFEQSEADGVYVLADGEKITVGGSQITDFYRAFMLFSTEIKKGNTVFEISQKRHFETLGMSLDLSRNGVIKIGKIKQIIDMLALLGFNVLRVYMEDVFELSGYPHFGYRRGRYSQEELKELDDYAWSMGIKIIPTVQTLGHLGQYLRYAETDNMRENNDVLLCGAEQTYKFVEEIFKTMRKCFRSDRICIGCDEASGIGLIRMKKEKRYIDIYREIVIPHIKRVGEIAEKYGFRPNLDGDLFYSHLGNGYYDFDFQPDEEKKKMIPDMDILYWDYYHLEYDDYKKLLLGHRRLNKNVIFVGGIWIWSGQLPQVDFTFKSMTPAMEVCLDYEVKDVWISTFGDDGNETNIAFALPSLPIFSEYCFRGKDCTEEEIYEISEALTGIDMKAFRALSDYHYPWVNEIEKSEYIWPNYMGKKIFYTDLFYNMTETYELGDILEKHIASLNAVKGAGKGTLWEDFFRYAELIFEITVEKIRVLMNIRKAYESRDLKALECIANEAVPGIKEKTASLSELHEEQWMNTYKPFGWEELGGRYAWILSRLDYVKKILLRFVNGEIASIPELEFDFVEARKGCLNRGGVVSFSEIKSTGM